MPESPDEIPELPNKMTLHFYERILWAEPHFLSSPPLCWCCSRQNDITPSLADCSVWKLDVYVCVCMYVQEARLRSTSWHWGWSTADGSTWRIIIFAKDRSGVCVCVRANGIRCVRACVFVCCRIIRETWTGKQWSWKEECKIMVALIKNGSWDLIVIQISVLHLCRNRFPLIIQ